MKDLDLSGNRLHGRPGRCIDIVKVEPRHRTQLRAGGDCYLGGLNASSETSTGSLLLGKPVDLFFSVLRNAQRGQWEIDEVKIE
jgi:hypothetical protein